MPNARQEDGRRTARAAAQKLESLAAAGITHLPKTGRKRVVAATAVEEVAAATINEPASEPRSSGRGYEAEKTTSSAAVAAGVTLFDARTAPGMGLSLAERVVALDEVRKEVAACTRCKELCAGRTQTVFGVGTPQARLVFLGEAPGADEDAQGEPFVGRAGQLLTKIIEACTLKREQVYILNVLKCRPPNNRTPAPDEVANCRGYLDRQLEIIRPEFICCLGAVAARTLLNTESSMAKLRGRFYLYNGIEVLCTYHPAYLLRNPPAKRDVWEDMKILMARLGIQL